tara:strand:+ start:2067 stop:2780 length:714 start_codon:yes stop_codon:yes gene_type:complete
MELGTPTSSPNTSKAKGTENNEKFTGLFALGLTDNIYLNMIVIFSIGIFGLLIKLFFAPSKDMYGNIGPANTNIGGYTLLLISFIIIFCSFFGVNNNIGKLNSDITKGTNTSLKDIVQKLLESRSFAELLVPIVIVCILIIYIIFINFKYFEKINKIGGAPPIYMTYEFIASLLFITTTIVIYKYAWEYFFRKDRRISMIKWVAILLSTFNMFILIIIHIILEFYTLGANEYITQNT